MRYTPIIDISEQPSIYQNINIRLVYLHMVLKSGYHDYNRDMLDISIRKLANDVGISVGATRHALQQLINAKMIVRQNNVYYVRKYILTPEITPRIKTKRQQELRQQQQEEQRKQEVRQQTYKQEQQRRDALRKQGKTEYMLYYETMILKAQNGDIEAQKIVARNKSIYEAHKAQIEAENNKK